MNYDDFAIRPATEQDIIQVRDIFSFYVLNTTISFMLDDPPLNYMIQRFKSTIERDLPYLVAVDSDNDTHVLGYCHASPFSSDKGGYAEAVDFSLFLGPDCTKRGIGGALLNALIKQLQTQPYRSWEQDKVGELQVQAKHLYAISSADLVSQGGWLAGGEANWKWYERFGFREVGRLPSIGQKFGHRYV